MFVMMPMVTMMVMMIIVAMMPMMAVVAMVIAWERIETLVVMIAMVPVVLIHWTIAMSVVGNEALVLIGSIYVSFYYIQFAVPYLC